MGEGGLDSQLYLWGLMQRYVSGMPEIIEPGVCGILSAVRFYLQLTVLLKHIHTSGSGSGKRNLFHLSTSRTVLYWRLL